MANASGRPRAGRVLPAARREAHQRGGGGLGPPRALQAGDAVERVHRAGGDGLVHVLEGDVFALAFGPEGRLLASGGRDGLVKVWNARTGAELLTLESPHRMVFALAFTRDGRALLTGGSSGGGHTPLSVLDLGRCAHRVAGNLGHHAAHLRRHGMDPPRLDAALRWAGRVRSADDPVP